MAFYINCPRCGNKTFEKLKTYSHCTDCFYFEDSWQVPEELRREALLHEEILGLPNESKTKTKQNGSKPQIVA